jgi:large subunit ribosomal protein L18
MKSSILENRRRAARRANRTRAKLHGTALRPRMSVFRSQKYLTVQVINDDLGRTLVAANDRSIDTKGKKPLEKAALIGAEVARLAKAAGVISVVFDRGSYMYHGRVKAVAEAAREAGLEF